MQLALQIAVNTQGYTICSTRVGHTKWKNQISLRSYFENIVRHEYTAAIEFMDFLSQNLKKLSGSSEFNETKFNKILIS